jgi:hypothetical protein
MKGLLVMVSLLAIWPWSASKEYPMKASSSVPAAAGIVKVQRDKDNGNTKLDIRVWHLANPSRLTPPANAYIVWVRPRNGAAVRGGAIRVDKDQKGEVKLVTVEKDFEVFITAEQTTAEQSGSADVPSDFQVLRADVTIN